MTLIPSVMKRTFFLAFAMMIPFMASAQLPDFTGAWKLNSSKSQLNQEFTMAPNEIIIVQKGNNLSVERHSSFQYQEFTTTDKFTLDGKECINKGWQDSQKKSTAVWTDDKKSLKISTKISVGDGGEMSLTETYKMDGSIMIIDSYASSDYGEMTETMAYDRK